MSLNIYGMSKIKFWNSDPRGIPEVDVGRTSLVFYLPVPCLVMIHFATMKFLGSIVLSTSLSGQVVRNARLVALLFLLQSCSVFTAIVGTLVVAVIIFGMDYLSAVVIGEAISSLLFNYYVTSIHTQLSALTKKDLISIKGKIICC